MTKPPIDPDRRGGGVNVFAAIYATDTWTRGSGPGSHPAACRPLIRYLNQFLKDQTVKDIVDLGCGDWQFMSQVALGGRQYLGLDVVDDILAANQSRFGGPNIAFGRPPDKLEDLAGADLLILKDVLIHLTNEDIIDITHIFPNFKFILSINNASDNQDEYNQTISRGAFRPVDLRLSPFNQNCETVLTYGTRRMLDPDLPAPIAFALRRFIWPGEKHVQLIHGGSSPRDRH